jgi:chemotaxis protein CheZ
MSEDVRSDVSIDLAKNLVEALEAKNTELVGDLIYKLTAERDAELFNEIGKLTREVHDALTGFHADSRISELTENDIPDAKERLNYVVTMTEQAAHRTMNAVEDSLPVAESMATKGEQLKTSWSQFRNKEMSSDEFRALCHELDDYFDNVGSQVSSIQSKLSEVLMAQDYQDITGQIIRRVIGLVQEVEGNLVGLIKVTGERYSSGEKKEKEDGIEAVGPAVPGVDTADVVSSQDDVDDLLSSLGF